VIRRLRMSALMIILLALLLAVAGTSYQAIETRSDERHSPEAGRLVDIGGYRLKINCIGRGSPTVVLEAGFGDVSVEWNRVQPEIAQFSRVCSYDRAGYGGSDSGPMPRTSALIATELHTLLQNAGEVPPYVLVGHSFGGYNVRVFNGKYPDQVAGVVLVDATQEDQYQLLPAAWGKIYESELKRCKRQALWAPIFIDLGVARLMLRSRGNLNENAYLILQSKYLQARASELEMIKTSAQQARVADNIADKPLIVLTGGTNSDQILSNGLTKQDFSDFHKVWVDELQVRLARLSTQGKQIIVPDSGHDIPNERPDTVMSAVKNICGLTSLR
jgi:pimeloyl-ACP methyl ester carboxylesterase